MSGAVAWLLVGLALAAVVVRRRSAGILLVTAQSVVLGVAVLVLAADRDAEFAVAAGFLVAKAALVGAALFWTLRRTRERAPVRDGLPGALRLAAAVVLALTAVALVPSFGLPSSIGNATVALVAVGAAIVGLRRATVFQALGLIVAENGIALAAASARDGLPLVIELGVLFDVVIVLGVLLLVHERIFGDFGTGDTRVLRGLRD